MQTYLVMWFFRVWGWEEAALGSLMMGANILGGLSSICAGHAVSRFGPTRVAVFSHLPSNLLLAAVPFMPSAGSAAAMLLARYCLSQMDVPARQALVQSLVEPSERSAAGGVTNVVRSAGLSAAPLLLGYLTAAAAAGGNGNKRVSGGGGGHGVSPLGPISYPFFIAAALKVVYDLALYRAGSQLQQRREAELKRGGGTGLQTGAATAGTTTATAEEEKEEEEEEEKEEEEEMGEEQIRVTEREGLLGTTHTQLLDEEGEMLLETISPE